MNILQYCLGVVRYVLIQVCVDVIVKNLKKWNKFSFRMIMVIYFVIKKLDIPISSLFRQIWPFLTKKGVGHFFIRAHFFEGWIYFEPLFFFRKMLWRLKFAGYFSEPSKISLGFLSLLRFILHKNLYIGNYMTEL